MYSDIGRPSIPPEQLLRALLLQALYTIRSERLLMEEIDYSILFRWFIGLSLDDPIWLPTTFSKNRDRLLEGEIASSFFDAVLDQARAAGLLSDEHFTVDGTMLEAWASLNSFRRKDAEPPQPPDDPGNPTVKFHGEPRKNDTPASTTDPDAQLYRKGHGKEAKLAYLGHVLLDNRQGLVANVGATAATGTAERNAALDRLLTETDSPFLAPVPYRGKRCEPAYVKEIAEVAAQVKGCSLEELSAATCATAERFFRGLASS